MKEEEVRVTFQFLLFVCKLLQLKTFQKPRYYHKGFDRLNTKMLNHIETNNQQMDGRPK